MDAVYIKPSVKILVRTYLKAYLLFSPLIFLMIFLPDGRQTMGVLLLLYYLPVTALFLWELIQNDKKIILELHDEGLQIMAKDRYRWEEIQELRLVEKRIRTRTARRGTQVTVKTLLRINGHDYDFNHRYLQFSPENLMEIISIYLNRTPAGRIEQGNENSDSHEH